MQRLAAPDARERIPTGRGGLVLNCRRAVSVVFAGLTSHISLVLE